MDKNNGTEYHIGNGHFINIKTSNIVKLYEQFIVYTEDGPITLNAEVSVDFAEIDSKYHEIGRAHV